MRYFLNNFTDGARQDAMDLFYGHYTVRLEDYYSPFIFQFDNRLIVAPVIMISCGLVLACLIFFHGLTRWRLMVLLLIVFFAAGFLVLQDGIQYVQYPRLRPPPVVTLARPWRQTIFDSKRHLLKGMNPSRKVHVI